MKNNNPLAEQFIAIARMARMGDYADAARELNGSLSKLMQALHSGKIASEQTLEKLKYSLETIFQMQKMNDWVAIADLLEFELSHLTAELKA